MCTIVGKTGQLFVVDRLTLKPMVALNRMVDDLTMLNNVDAAELMIEPIAVPIDDVILAMVCSPS